GTENVAGIVGLGAAIQLLEAEIEARRAHCLTLRERLLAGLLALPGSHLNGPREGRLANNVNVSFDHVNGEGLLISLDQQGIAASTGSACSSGSTDPSHVLLALGGDRDIAHGSLRLTLGQSNTEAHVDRAVAAVAEALEQLRGLDPTGRAATV
ncbi:MAG TPA: cysteine desulfurase NifS, partial [Armatimonadetes bacterium]|nr:cysteine desulfurase NifS [Armatimonadota bacterium]